MGGHGHVIPNTDGTKARCGGPQLCRECALEYTQNQPNFYGSVRGKGSTLGIAIAQLILEWIDRGTTKEEAVSHLRTCLILLGETGSPNDESDLRKTRMG